MGVPLPTSRSALAVPLLVVPVLVVSLLAAACAGSDERGRAERAGGDALGDAGSGQVDELGNAVTTYHGLVADVAASGSVDAAVALFAYQYGPPPGGAEPRGPVGSEGHESGTFAATAVFSVWDQLDESQRTWVRQRLDLDEGFTPTMASDTHNRATGAAGTTAPGARRLRGGGTTRSQPEATAYVAALERAQTRLRAHIGPLAATVRVEIGQVPSLFQGRPALAEALLVDSSTCRIRVFPSTFPAPGAGDVSTMAHELVHCYQQEWNGGVLPRDRWWVQEGGAEWAATKVQAEVGGPGDADSAGYLGEWVSTAPRPLFSRTYDAWPFLATADELTGAMWSRFRAFTTAPTAQAAYLAAAGGEPDVRWVTQWATSQAWFPSLGEHWRIDGTGVPSVPRPDTPPSNVLGNGQRLSIDAPAYATGWRYVRVGAETFRIETPSVAGAVHVNGTERSIAEMSNRTWCTGDELSCVCPPGTRRAGQRLPRLSAERMVLAHGGGSQPAPGALVGRTLADECDRELGCPVGTWVLSEAAIAVDGVEVVSGGTGIVMQITEDGTVLQDYSRFDPLVARGSIAGDPMGGTSAEVTVYLAPTGQVKSRIDLPEGGATYTSSPVRDVDAAGLVGEGYSELDGQRIEYSVEELRSVVAGVVADPRFAVSAVPVELACEEPDTIVLRAGGRVGQRYVRQDG